MRNRVLTLRSAIRAVILKQVFPRGIFPKKHYRFSPAAERRDASTAPALVVLCLWNRPSHFRTLLEKFAEQDVPHGVTIGLWNNDFSGRGHYQAELRMAQRQLTGTAIHSVTLVNSPLNTGGIGRFYLARALAAPAAASQVIYLDDDQVIRSDFVRSLQQQARPHSLMSWWGHEIYDDEYWNRRRTLPGERCDYAGTGGMIMDTALLSDDSLFRDLPDRFWFLEDIWLNHIALQNGYHLGTLSAEIDFVLDETNQGHRLQSLKPEFYRLLAQAREQRP